MKEKLANPNYNVNIPGRSRTGAIWRGVLQASTIVGIIALATLLLNVINGAFGYVALEARVDPATLAVDGVPLARQSKEQLIAVLQSNLSSGAFNKLERDQAFADRSRANIYQLVLERIVRYDIKKSWQLWDSLIHANEIKATVAQDYPNAQLRFLSWFTSDFVSRPQTSEALTAGVRTAILGSLWTILFTILVAFPLGVGAAIYLEEYATDNWLNRLIRTNINNLAGVPSIVYGILGLAIFVRALEPLTSGSIFGLVDPTTANGRTVLAAGLTLGLLVPQSLRKASYGIGATKWQTVWSHVLPNAMPGILTGTILAISRAIGETAPLVVVGASTAISFDPASPFSKFTTLPIQIYQWTSRPQDEFRSLAAAAILVLLIILLSLNASAILLRNRFSRKY
jgi:phosphate transport system permease protein